jgi:hypothetical protein
MPIAPLLSDTQNLDTDGPRAAAVATPDAYGAGLGRALAAFGDQAFSAVAALDERASAADARNADAEFQRGARDILFGRTPNPESDDPTLREARQGYYDMKGADAVAQRVTAEDELNALRDRIEQGRRSNGSAEAFRDLASRRMQAYLESMDRHAMGETRTYEDQARQAQLIESRNSAVAAYLDEAAAAAEINTGINVVLEQADLDGLSPERTEQAIKDWQSGAWAAVILRRFDDDPTAAQEIFEARRGTMNAEDVARVTGATREVVLADRARTQVSALMEQAGGDFRAFLALAEDIPDTRLRDEVIARGERLANARESAEARDADNVEERARSAIAAGGIDAVSAADRAYLAREGRWNGILAELRALSSGNQDGSEHIADTLEAIAVDNPIKFHRMMQVIRGGYTPAERAARDARDAVTGSTLPNPRELENAAVLAERRAETEAAEIQDITGYTPEQLRALRPQLNGDDYRRVRELQEYLSGNRPSDDTGRTLIQQAYSDLHQFVTPMAERQGLYLGGAPPGLGVQQLNTLAQQRGQYEGRLMAEARRFVEEHHRAPNPADMDAIAQRMLVRGRAGTGGMFAGQRMGFQASQSQRVTVPYERIPRADRERLADAWAAGNPESSDAAAMRRWVAQQYADDLQAE